MEASNRRDYIKDLLENMSADCLNQTTHRLDIYEENLTIEALYPATKHIMVDKY